MEPAKTSVPALTPADEQALQAVMSIAGGGEQGEMDPTTMLRELQRVREGLLMSGQVDMANEMVIAGLCGIVGAQARLIMSLAESQHKLQETVSLFASRVARAVKRKHELEIRASKDRLTGLMNQSTFAKVAPRAFAMARRKGEALSYLLIDVDKFKDVNDTLGHPAGDYVLRELGKLVESVMRITDLSFRTDLKGKTNVVARDGGEEMSVLLPETDLDGACIAAERLRVAVEKHVFVYRGRRIPVTISIGAGQADFGKDTKFPELKDRTDKVLYEAKADGRNCVHKSYFGEDGEVKSERVLARLDD